MLFFLASTPRLSRLSLREFGLSDSATNPLANSELPSVVLPRLDYLSLRLHTIDARALGRFLNALTCQHLDVLYLYTGFDGVEDIVQDCTRAAYQEVAQFSQRHPDSPPRIFEFKVEPIHSQSPDDSDGDEPQSEESTPFSDHHLIKFFPGDIFWQLPTSIEKLTIHNVDFYDDSQYSYSDYALPELSELIIRKSSAKLAFDEHFYSALSRVLKRLGVKLDRFRLVTDDEEDEDETDGESEYVGGDERESNNDGADEDDKDEKKRSRMEEVKAKVILRNAAVLE